MTTAPRVTIRRIRPSDGLQLRGMRLRSIADAPDAFGQPIEEARTRPDADWHRSARRSSRGDARTWLFAAVDEEVVGLVQGRRRRPSTLLLFSMWVEPAARRHGVGSRLIDALERWARGWAATETVLWVYGRNQAARDFYLRLGFEIVRDGPDAESGQRFAALAMRRDIHAVPGSNGTDGRSR